MGRILVASRDGTGTVNSRLCKKCYAIIKYVKICNFVYTDFDISIHNPAKFPKIFTKKLLQEVVTLSSVLMASLNFVLLLALKQRDLGY